MGSLRGSPHRSSIATGLKGLSLWYAKTKRPRIGWVVMYHYVPTLEAWEASRLKMMGLEALPTYKRVVAWFLGPAEDTQRYFEQLHRLNQRVNSSHWRDYKRKEKPNRVHLVPSIDSSSTAALEEMRWCPFSGVGQAVFSLLSVRPEGRKYEEKKRSRPTLTWQIPLHLFRPTYYIVSLLLGFSPQLHLSNKPWYREAHIIGLNIPDYTLP